MRISDRHGKRPRNIRPHANTNGEEGFTLMETCIALVLLLIVSLGVVSLFTYAVKFNSGANERAVAQAIAQHQMEQLRKLSFDQVVAATVTVTNQGHDYTVTTTVCTTTTCGGSDTLKVITVQVTPLSTDTPWVTPPITLTTRRSAADAGPYLL